MCGHANIFHLWVKCQLSWIVQITWICDIHLCITIQSNSHNIKQCSISNSLWYKKGNLCLIFLTSDTENAWHLTEFILPQYISTLTWLVGFLVGWNHSTLINKTLTSFNFYFYQILTAFHMLSIVSEVAHDNWKKLQLLTGLIK
jgi:hypothetical protein